MTAALGAVFAGALASSALAAEGVRVDLVDRASLRVCADPANMPFSNDKGEGFENKIAEIVASELKVPVSYVWFPQAIGFIRQTLFARRCDVVIGYAQGDELVLNTNHYYTSTHVLIVRADGDLADVTTLADPRLKGRRIGVIAGTPPASHLARHGLMATVKGFHLMVDTRHEHPNSEMIAELMAGELDAAVQWGPAGGPLARAEGDALKVTPLIGEEGSPRLFYRITMGVRQGEDVWKRELNTQIRALQPEIDAILTDFGVPLVNDMGTAMKDAAAP